VETKQQRELLLLSIVVVLGALAYGVYVEWSGTSAMAPATSNQEQRNPGGRGARKGPFVGEADGAPIVHLDELSTERRRPQAGRDLFRFKEKPPPPPPPPPPPRVPTPEELVPAGPPPPPPITLKFIGFVDSDNPGKRLAFLSDGRGAPISGHEGDTVLGQYRILRISAESIEMSYLDGRGRQTIRLSGS
jgi:hypothetical protein